MMRQREPPFPRVLRGACRKLERRKIIRNIDASDTAGHKKIACKADQAYRVGNVLQHVVHMHDIEAAESRRCFCIEKSLNDFNAQFACMGGSLARGLDAQHTPTAGFCGLQEKSRSGAYIQQSPLRWRQAALKDFQSVGLREFCPGLILGGMTQKGRLFSGVIVFAIGLFQCGRLRKWNGMAKPARLAIQDIVVFVVREAWAGVALPFDDGSCCHCAHELPPLTVS